MFLAILWSSYWPVYLIQFTFTHYIQSRETLSPIKCAYCSFSSRRRLTSFVRDQCLRGGRCARVSLSGMKWEEKNTIEYSAREAKRSSDSDKFYTNHWTEVKWNNQKKTLTCRCQARQQRIFNVRTCARKAICVKLYFVEHQFEWGEICLRVLCAFFSWQSNLNSFFVVRNSLAHSANKINCGKYTR